MPAAMPATLALCKCQGSESSQIQAVSPEASSEEALLEVGDDPPCVGVDNADQRHVGLRGVTDTDREVGDGPIGRGDKAGLRELPFGGCQCGSGPRLRGQVHCDG